MNKLNKILTFITATFVLIFFTACNKSPTTNSTPTDTIPIVITTPPTIYISGDTGYATDLYPIYWKNGKLIHLSTSHGIPIQISLIGKDIYILNTYGSNIIQYWKNEVPVYFPSDLTISRNIPVGMAISNNNIYIAGNSEVKVPYGDYIPVYWKNSDIAKHLENSNGSVATGIAVSGNDVFVSGQSYNTISIDKFGPAVYWKNGVKTRIFPGSDLSAKANAIAISDTNIYIAGIVNPNNFPLGAAVYWKNGVLNYLGSDGHESTVNSIVIVGNDVYATGGIVKSNGLTEAVYWKNGVPVYLSNSTAQQQACIARSIVINGNDVYVVGNIGEYGATLWKNGVATPLGGYCHAYSIALGN